MGIHTTEKMLKLHVFSLSHNISVWNTWTKLISFQSSKGGHEKYGRQTIRVHLQACCSSQLQFAFSIAACKWIVQWNSACCANAAGAIFLQCAQFFSAVHPKQCNHFFCWPSQTVQPMPGENFASDKTLTSPNLAENFWKCRCFSNHLWLQN